MRIPYVILVSVGAVLLSDMLASGTEFSPYAAAMDIMPAVIALWLQQSSLYEVKHLKSGVDVMVLLNLLLLVVNVYRLNMNPDLRLSDYSVIFLSLLTVSVIVLFVCGLAWQMADVKSLMKNGTVWAVVCLVVDVVYLFFIIAGVALVQAGWPLLGILSLGGTASGILFRGYLDSKFLIWQEQEILIVESMKVTSVTSAKDPSNIEDIYKELYDRIVAYFEENKPYLDSALTIKDLIKDIYSNKLYISKAISQFTGRNFCQFVNYYRVVHSMECFRKNPELRVHELAMMSGFNSIVSFTMAFRLFMGETPGDWCRKERKRLLKKGK